VPDGAKSASLEVGILNGVYKPELMTQDHQQFTHSNMKRTQLISQVRALTLMQGIGITLQIFPISPLRVVQNTVNVNSFQFMIFVH